MKTLNEKRMIAIANIETGAVRRVDAESTSGYFKVSKEYKKRIWYPTSKEVWRRFRDLNPENAADSSKPMVAPMCFTIMIPRDKVSGSDTIYDHNHEGDMVLVLINVTAGSDKGYGRKESRRWNDMTSSRSSNRKQTKARKVYIETTNKKEFFKEVEIEIADLDRMILTDKKVRVRTRKGGKDGNGEAITPVTQVEVRMYPRSLVNKIRNQIKYGFNNRQAEGAIVRADTTFRSKITKVSVLVRKDKKSQLRRIVRD